MKRLFSSPNVAEVGLLKSFLAQEGIDCTTRNEHLSIASGAVPFVDCYPELWVLNDEDFTNAQELVSRWQNQGTTQFESWRCPDCGEENEGQFGACWQCGYLVDE
jgi:hypothetical protein